MIFENNYSNWKKTPQNKTKQKKTHKQPAQVSAYYVVPLTRKRWNGIHIYRNHC